MPDERLIEAIRDPAAHPLSEEQLSALQDELSAERAIAAQREAALLPIGKALCMIDPVEALQRMLLKLRGGAADEFVGRLDSPSICCVR